MTTEADLRTAITTGKPDVERIGDRSVRLYWLLPDTTPTAHGLSLAAKITARHDHGWYRATLSLTEIEVADGVVRRESFSLLARIVDDIDLAREPAPRFNRNKFGAFVRNSVLEAHTRPAEVTDLLGALGASIDRARKATVRLTTVTVTYDEVHAVVNAAPNTPSGIRTARPFTDLLLRVGVRYPVKLQLNEYEMAALTTIRNREATP